MGRHFLLLVHRVPVDGEFTLNDLAGSGGRMDEVAAVVASCFLVSNGLRRDAELTLLILSDPARARRVHMVGSRLRFLNPDERSTAALLKNALVRSRLRPQQEMETTPGITVGPARFPQDLQDFASVPGTLWATEAGVPLRGLTSGRSGDLRVVVSDPWDPSEEERKVLEGSRATPVSVGPRSLRASQCVVLFQNEWDLREVPSEGGGPGTAPS